jgi:hypothetical protein
MTQGNGAMPEQPTPPVPHLLLSTAGRLLWL